MFWLNLLSAYGAYALIGFIWFFLGALTQFITAFRWIPIYNLFEKPAEFLVMTIPHALILGLASSLMTAFFLPRLSLILVWFPIGYAILAFAVLIFMMMR